MAEVIRRDLELEEISRRLSAYRELILTLPNLCQCRGGLRGQEEVGNRRGSGRDDGGKTEYVHLPDVLDDIFKASKLTHLKKLTIRRLESLDDASGLLWESLHMHQLTQLVLAGCDLGSMNSELQFWTVPNLTHLNLDRTKLSYLPASIGRLRQLQSLSLNGNDLHSLPNTLSFCASLQELNLESNHFSLLPGVILQLPSLRSLRRYGCSNLHTGAIDVAAASRANKYIRIVLERQQSESNEDLGVVVPLKLLAVQALITHRIDYWGDGVLAPAVCKIMDIAQVEYKICEVCWVARARHVPGYKVQWLVESYLGLRHIPFEHTACSVPCAQTLQNRFKKIQSRLMDQHDKEYQEMLERYASEEGAPGDRGRRSSSNRLRIVETWNLDGYAGRNGSSWRRGVPWRWDTRGRTRKCIIL